MVATVTKLNGHWDGFVNADIPLTDGSDPIVTIAQAIAWKAENGYTAENSKVYWPQVKDGSGRVFHLSTVATATMLATDLSNDSVPFESPSNKEIMATAQYFGANSANRGFDQETANTLNEQGITTACFWAARWVLWGPHTAAYAYNGSMDARAVFDVNMRMLIMVTFPQLDNPQNATSTCWKAINATTGALVEPECSTTDTTGTTSGNTVRLDWVSNAWVFKNAITNVQTEYKSCTFGKLTAGSTIGEAAKVLLRALALLPDEGTTEADYEGDMAYWHNGAAERCVYRGGNFTSGASAGVFYVNGNAARSSSTANVGFRSAYIPEIG